MKLEYIITNRAHDRMVCNYAMAMNRNFYTQCAQVWLAGKKVARFVYRLFNEWQLFTWKPHNLKFVIALWNRDAAPKQKPIIFPTYILFLERVCMHYADNKMFLEIVCKYMYTDPVKRTACRLVSISKNFQSCLFASVYFWRHAPRILKSVHCKLQTFFYRVTAALTLTMLEHTFAITVRFINKYSSSIWALISFLNLLSTTLLNK